MRQRAILLAAVAAAALLGTGCPVAIDPSAGPNDGSLLRANRDLTSITFIGHSTTLIQVDGVNVLTDPYYGMTLMGTGRYQAPGVAWENLPEIDVVLLSHDHLDHFNYYTLYKLPSTTTILASAGTAKLFADPKIQAKVVLMKPGQTHDVGDVMIAAERIYHPSKRWLVDRDSGTLGYVVKGADYNVLFVGDSGPCPECYRKIGARHRVDVAILPIGPIIELMHHVHEWPGDALDAMDECGAKIMVPVHWGTWRYAEYPRHTINVLKRETAVRGVEKSVKILEHGDSFFLAPRSPDDPVTTLEAPPVPRG
jgi:L-ascorbate metabolism protein UlaG (beta-lactamase superfamily)